MAVAEPPEELVQEFIAVSGGNLSRQDTILRLKGHDNNIDQAMNEYFDDPTSTKYKNPKITWDDTLHDADRNGQTDGNFEIHAGDDIVRSRSPYLQHDGGKSAGPSRVPSPHPRYGPHQPGGDPTMPKLLENSEYGAGDDQDQDMAMAIRASLEQDSANTTFGPATRPEGYDGEWGMILASNAAQTADPEPACRKRDPGHPAFLRPSKPDHRIAALITIFHEVPLLREVMLDSSNVMPNYSGNPEWWNGKPVELSAIIEEPEDELSDNEPKVSHIKAYQEFRAEIQRLTAFLDKTERSYGSVDALMNTQAVRDSMNHYKNQKTLDEIVVELWGTVLSEDAEKYGTLFSRVSSLQHIRGHHDGKGDMDFALFDLDFPDEDSTAETIYDLADRAMWNDDGQADISSSPYLSHVADVVSFRINNWTIQKKSGVDFPAVWYPDRYLESSREKMLKMRAAKSGLQKKLENLSALEIKLTEFESISGTSVKVQDVITAALHHDRDETEVDGEARDVEMELSSQNTQNLSSQLMKLAESLDRKVKALNEEKERCKEELRELSKLYTMPSDDPAQQVLHRYTLRGVCMDKSTMFLCRREKQNLIDVKVEDELQTADNEQWWRINYAVSDPSPVSVEKTTEERVLDAARFHTESGGPIVIYASDRAMQWESRGLPPALEKFVEKDNAFFKEEFSSTPSPSHSNPQSPGKRKYDDAYDIENANWNNDIQELPALERDVEPSWNGTQRAGSLNLSPSVRLSSPPSPPSPPSSPTKRRRSLSLGRRHSTDREKLPPSYEQSHDVVVGVEPSSGQEMQERSGARLLSVGSRKEETTTTIDSMDLDTVAVVEDELQAKESGAVRQVR